MYKEFDRGFKPTWCTGCGDYGVLRSLQQALAELEIKPHQLVAVSGIGCSGRISGYINAYTFHSAHGRSLPVAQGIKLARPELTVLALGGDGDGFAIGLNHSLQAARRNVDVTYIVMTNNIYGLTKGQTSPLSPKGFITSATPHGSPHAAFNPALLMLSAGAGFVAQGITSKQKQVQELIVKAIAHPGFSFVNIYSPCVTFNKIHTYNWFSENLTEASHDPADFAQSITEVVKNKGLLTGVIYETKNRD